VYGLAGNAFDTEALSKIFEVKGRPHFDPLIVHLASIDAVDSCAREFPAWAEKLARKFWPGPLTIVLPKNAMVPDLATSGLDTVGLRVPNHSLTLELLQSLSFPLAAPSANPFGYVSPTTSEHVRAQLGHRIQYILDGGASAVGIESTIIGELGGKPCIFRLGGTSLEEIRNLFGDVVLANDGAIVSPGTMQSHYATRIPMILGEPEEPQSNFGALRFMDALPEIDLGHQIILSASGDLHEAAANLFRSMRQLDEMKGLDVIYGELVPDMGIGRAINDRLKRASVGRPLEV
jgi:L-threonylcarbamoyladenylate synthase